jgi:hypothetical protein
MDPNLFHLDWARVAEILVAVTVLAFFIERALALLFESRFFLEKVQGKRPAGQQGGSSSTDAQDAPGRGKSRSGVGTFPIKELLAFAVAGAVCLVWRFDAISMIFLKERTTILGALVTGAVVAGGSKASVKLFRDVMGVKSTARQLLDQESAAGK